MCDYIKSIISICLSILVFISIFQILSDTKNDEFQQPFSIGEKEKMFYGSNTNPLIDSSIVSIKCEMYQNTIMDPKVSKMGEVFNLNMKLIHDKIKSLLIVEIFAFVFLVFFLICMIISVKAKSLSLVCLSCIMMIASIGFTIANFIYLYRVIVIFYNSDMNQFMEFLKCKNINRDGFDKYLYAEDLYKHFTRFVILNIIHILWNLSSSQSDKKNEGTQGNITQDIELTENL